MADYPMVGYEGEMDGDVPTFKVWTGCGLGKCCRNSNNCDTADQIKNGEKSCRRVLGTVDARVTQRRCACGIVRYRYMLHSIATTGEYRRRRVRGLHPRRA